ncbi:MAG: ferredoxin reductase, partial [Actinomycetales bacterium]
VDDGIVVDDAFRTSAEGIWAAGDVARADHATLGSLRVEHWDNAIKQGSAAARSILGQDVHHDWQPYFFTDQFEFSMEYVGHGSGENDVEVRGDVDEHQFIAYWLDGDTVTAAMNVGIWDVNEKLRDLVGTTVDREQLTDLR